MKVKSNIRVQYILRTAFAPSLSQGLYNALMLILFINLLSACSVLPNWIYETPKREPAVARVRRPAPVKEKKTKVNIQALETEKPPIEKSYLELIWQIPSGPTEGFVIRYGYSRDKLEFETKVGVNDLERYEDPSYGYVYRYLLQDQPDDKSVFVAIASFDKDKTSEFSEIYEIPKADKSKNTDSAQPQRKN